MRAKRLRKLLTNLGDEVTVAICCDHDMLDLHDVDRVEMAYHPLYPKQRVIVLHRKEVEWPKDQ